MDRKHSHRWKSRFRLIRCIWNPENIGYVWLLIWKFNNYVILKNVCLWSMTNEQWIPQPSIFELGAVHIFAINFSQTNLLSLSICFPSNARHDFMFVHDKEILNAMQICTISLVAMNGGYGIPFSYNGCVWNLYFSLKTVLHKRISKPFQNTNKCVTHFASLTTNSNIYSTIAS